MKTKKGLQRYFIRKVYFDYWRIQNNQNYIKFWEEVKTLGEKAHTKYIYDPPMEEGETYPEWFLRTEAQGKGKKESWLVKEMRRFGVWLPLPDPFKKIEWENFIENPDKDIIESMTNAYAYNADLQERFNIKINPLEDGFEIMDKVMNHVYFLRFFMATAGIIKPSTRDHLNKYHLYAQCWDMMKGPSKMTPREIAAKLRQSKWTIISRLKKAGELLFGKKDEPIRLKMIKGLLAQGKTCKNCPQKMSCELNKTLCPDILIQLEEVEIKQRHKLGRLIEDKEGNITTTYEIASDHQAYLNWLRENN